MKIRKALKSDIKAWSELRTALWPDTEDMHISELTDYFDGRSIDIVECYVVDLDGELVGFMELNIRNFVEGSRNSKVPYVEGWYIHPDHQDKGFGKKLMTQAENWALSKGFSELASDTEVHNKKSIEVHKHLGFVETERVVCFLKNLKKA